MIFVGHLGQDGSRQRQFAFRLLGKSCRGFVDPAEGFASAAGSVAVAVRDARKNDPASDRRGEHRGSSTVARHRRHQGCRTPMDERLDTETSRAGKRVGRRAFDRFCDGPNSTLMRSRIAI